ncbi:type II toxin-antitoxin system HicA family toxin [Crocosphaera sp.]|uniref:type II toxin-antitoxin system HicA family toxin n=1 Tax=Crocosphaera sp. TaxID=2729996 RepID=UPI002610C4C0|nr:type II toxin-antitoxin system HicA family toxin [Crocosphaera sp.]MDJ0580714.1 type II toxin-antitoxin system HicA family toxin [Crocosphaera sp.]
MKLPRDLSGQDLVKNLKKLGYKVTHQTGSHIRLTTEQQGEHHITIPAHNPLKVGTLNAILRNISNHFQLNRDELLHKLFEK